MTSAWVTGAHGFIGRNLALTLRAGGYRVAGLGHGAWPDSEAARWGLSYWQNGEIATSNLDYMRALWGPPAVIFHLAGGSSVGTAIAHPYEDFNRTVVSTAVLLEWLRQHSADSGLVAVSSAAVYGAAHRGSIAEDAPLEPYSPYGVHKRIMEDLCRSYSKSFGVRVVLPRLFSVYGPGLKKQLLWDLCGKIESGNPIVLGGTGDELRDWIHVRDVCASLVQVSGLASADAPAINIGTGTGTSVREIASLATSRWGAAASSRQITFSGRSRPGDPFSLVADKSRAESLGIGTEIPVSRGIPEYVDWYRTQSGAGA